MTRPMKASEENAMVDSLDGRIRCLLQEELGFELGAFPAKGVQVRASVKRVDEHWKRLKAVRIGDSAVVTCLPSLLDTITPAIQSMTTWELFSPLGEAELRRALGPEVGKELFHGLQYVLSDRGSFRPARTPHTPRPLGKDDIPSAQHVLRMSERRRPVRDDFIWAFACYRDSENVSASDLAEFGRQCVSIAIVIWNEGQGIATYGLGTHEGYRGQGYALANMTAATDYVLEQGGVAYYEAAVTNIPSLRIPRRLGFTFAWQEMRA